DAIAAHSEGYSPRCSCTIRTARSRTSCGYLPRLLIAPSSHRMEPPLFPGRFIRDSGGQPDLVIIQGRFQASLEGEVWRVFDPLEMALVIRNVDVSNAPRLDGVIGGLPVLHNADPRLVPSVHVADMSELEYLQSNPDPQSTDEVMLQVDQIDRDRAVRMLV